MVIQHNISALNSHRNMGVNNDNTSKNLEKLSSGYKINRAGDDAAGLAISEKMRGQIRGLDMAENNVGNAISLIQTAEGGLNETHAIMQRMRELAVQSANGTFDEEVDRANLDKEFQSIKSEIDRIAESTHYNGLKLLDGSMGGIKSDYNNTAAAAGASTVLSFAAVTLADGTGTLAADDGATVYNGNISISWSEESDGRFVISANIKDVDGVTRTLTLDPQDLAEKYVAAGSYAPSGVYSVTASDSDIAATGAQTALAIDASGVVTVTDANGTTMQITLNKGVADPTAVNPATDAASGSINNIGFSYGDGVAAGAFNVNNAYQIEGKGQMIFQIGANGGADQRVSLSVQNMDSKNLGLGSGEMLSDASVGTQDDANKAIDIITAATNQVSAVRADLGALQNRLEHTSNSLGVSKENLTAAESSIRDVDMAEEMMEFTKNNILVQASQAMLAQANQLPQGVLSLLR